MDNNNIFNIIEEVAMESGFAKDGVTVDNEKSI